MSESYQECTSPFSKGFECGEMGWGDENPYDQTTQNDDYWEWRFGHDAGAEERQWQKEHKNWWEKDE